MIKKRLIIFLTICPLVMSMIVSGCKAETSSFNEEMPVADNTLVWNLSSEDITFWDPHSSASSVVYDINRQIFEGLTVLGENGYELGAAESFTVSPNDEGVENTVYTFEIRKDAKWSDGKDLTAYDFEYSFKRACGQKGSGLSAMLGLYIKGAEDYINGKGNEDDIAVNSIDEKVFKIELREPVPYFPQIAAMLFPVRQDVVESNGEGWETNPDTCISNGPYTIYFYEPGSYILLSKNNNYYDMDSVKTPYIKCLINNSYNNEFSHIMMIYPNNDMKDDDMLFTDYIGTSWIWINTKKEPLNDINVRKALSYAIDRQYLCENLYYGSIPAPGIIPPDMRLHDGVVGDKRVGTNYIDTVNPQKARGLISKTEYKDDFPEIELTVIREYEGQLFKSMIENNADIKIKLNIVSFEELLKKDREGDYEMLYSSWAADYYDPMAYLANFISNSGDSSNSWYSYDFEEAIENSLKAEGKERDNYLMQAEKILIDELPAIPLNHYCRIYRFNNKAVENLKCDVMGNLIIKGCELNLEEAGLKQAKEEIDKKGYYEDSGGYKFDKYIVSEHFELYYSSNDESNEGFASSSVEILEKNYDRILKFLDVKEKDMPNVKVYMYDQYEPLRQVTLKDASFDGDAMAMDAFQGIAIGKDTIYFTLKSKSEKYTDIGPLILHEFTHTVTYALVGEKTPPAWLWEGTAMYLAGQGSSDKSHYNYLLQTGLPKLYELNDSNSHYKYTYGHSLVEFIIGTYVREKLVELLKEGGDLEKVLNITENELRDEWTEFYKTKIGEN
ncbi:ABC transporter substrate-binding protein [Sedimentibacter sp.]|uniref:ABC transporter substrate-binding protein n=1 Tax=Sedimentibacter sp. TaxID=1960295 RepID=UPI00289CB000|nr:ABC transporter substrate-binding protein [Sedimentibacter sp.]